MILSDFLSRQKNDSNPHKIIPISFNMYQVLDDNYYSEKYLIQTSSQARSSSIKPSRSPWLGEEFRSQSKDRKTAYHTQTRKYGNVSYRSGKSWIKKKET